MMESSIDKLSNAVATLADRVGDMAQALDTLSRFVTAQGAPVVEADEAQMPLPFPVEQAPEPEPITLHDVRAMLRKVRDPERARALVLEYDVQKVSELHPDAWQQVYERAAELVGAGG